MSTYEEDRLIGKYKLAIQPADDDGKRKHVAAIVAAIAAEAGKQALEDSR